MSVADAFAAIVTACLAHYRSNEAVLVATRDPEALHQMRVALRRLRSAFWLFKPALKDARFKAFRNGIRHFTSDLGAARNVDVCIARSSKGSRERRWLKAQRMHLYETSIKNLRDPRWRRLLFEISAWTDSGEWRNSPHASSPLLPMATRRIDQLWNRILKFGPDPAKLRNDRRHRLRIAIKMLRYALGFLEGPLRSAKREWEIFDLESEALQNTLGKLTDGEACCELRSSAGLKPKRRRAAKRKHLSRARQKLEKLRRATPYWREGCTPPGNNWPSMLAPTADDRR